MTLRWALSLCIYWSKQNQGSHNFKIKSTALNVRVALQSCPPRPLIAHILCAVSLSISFGCPSPSPCNGSFMRAGSTPAFITSGFPGKSVDSQKTLNNYLPLKQRDKCMLRCFCLFEIKSEVPRNCSSFCSWGHSQRCLGEQVFSLLH